MTALTRETTLSPPTTLGDKSWLMGDMQQFGDEPLEVLSTYPAKYGPIIHINSRFAQRLGPIRYFLATHPDYLQQMLQSNNRNYIKEQRLMGILESVGDKMLFTTDGQEWLERRRKMQPAFHRKEIDNFGAIMTEETEKMLERWREAADRQEMLDIASEMTRLTMLVIGRTMFSLDFSQDADIFDAAYSVFTRLVTERLSTFLPAPLFIPTEKNRQLKGAMKTIRSEIKQMIQDRLAEPLESDRPTDLMDMLLDSYAAQEDPLLTYDELISELNGIIFAGHETTANILTWVFYLLSEHPAAAQKLDEELATVLLGRSPTMEDLPHLPYTHMVLDETMRLYPSAWISSRQAVEEDRFDNYLIPAGAKIFLNIWGMHRHPDYWEKPDSFYPEHFTPERVAARHKFAFIPFGAGPRKCIGERFAKTEAALVLATVFPRVSLRIKEGFVPVPEADFTLQAKGGMPMHIEIREAVPA